MVLETDLFLIVPVLFVILHNMEQGTYKWVAWISSIIFFCFARVVGYEIFKQSE